MTKHDQNSQNFANQNKTSNKDPRENIGMVGAQPTRIRPNVGGQKNNKKPDSD